MTNNRTFSRYTYKCLGPCCLYHGKFFLIEGVLQCPECSTFLRFPRLGAQKMSKEERVQHEGEVQKEEEYWKRQQDKL